MNSVKLFLYLAGLGVCLAAPSEVPPNAADATTEKIENKMATTMEIPVKNPVDETKSIELPGGSSDYIFEISTTVTPVQPEQSVNGNGEMPKQEENPQNIETSKKSDDILENNIQMEPEPKDIIPSANDANVKSNEDSEENVNDSANDDDLLNMLQGMTLDSNDDNKKDLSHNNKSTENCCVHSNIRLRIFNRPLVSKVYDRRSPVHMVVNPLLLLVPKTNSGAEYRTLV